MSDRLDYLNKVLENTLYIVDANIKNTIGTRPTNHFIQLEKILPIDIADDIFLEFAKKQNKIIVTKDILFVLENLIDSRNVIYQNKHHVRYYLTLKESKIIQNTKNNIYKKLSNLLKISKKVQCITEITKTVLDYDNLDILNINEKMKYLEVFDSISKQRRIFECAEKNNLIIISNDKHMCIQVLFQFKKCIFVDDKSILHYIEIDYFEFEKVTPHKIEQIIQDDINTYDTLQNNIRFIRNYISAIEKNVNFVECELRRRKETEATLRGEPLLISKQRNQLWSCYG